MPSWIRTKLSRRSQKANHRRTEKSWSCISSMWVYTRLEIFRLVEHVLPVASAECLDLTTGCFTLLIGCLSTKVSMSLYRTVSRGFHVNSLQLVDKLWIIFAFKCWRRETDFPQRIIIMRLFKWVSITEFRRGLLGVSLVTCSGQFTTVTVESTLQTCASQENQSLWV